MPKHKFVNSIAHSKELTFYDSKLKMLLLFGLLVFVLNKIVRVSMDKKITILQSGGGILDFPASETMLHQVKQHHNNKFSILQTLVLSPLASILHLELRYSRRDLDPILCIIRKS
jgi:hypothetical protein